MPAVDWEAVVGVTTALAVVVAIGFGWAESRRSRRALQVEVLLKFEADFASPRMIRARRAAAQGLMQGKPERCDGVIDFFEMVGLMVRRKALDDALAWNAFYRWVDGYAQAARDYVDQSREDDGTIWENFVWLHGALQEVERRNRGVAPHALRLDGAALAAFLKEERALPLPPA